MASRPAGTDRLEFRLLGPFEAAADGHVVYLGGPRVRGVLARLVVDAGRTVSLTALVDDLWDGRAPLDAARTVRTYVSRLRKALTQTPDVLLTRPPGYLLHVDCDAVDSLRFERLAQAGRRSLAGGRAQLAFEELTEALQLWRGAALAEFEDMPVLRGEAARLERLRLTVLEDRNDAALALGLESRVAADVEDLVRAHPLRERMWGQLMTALYRSGRQAEALAAFRDARAAMIAEHGVEPSPALVDVHLRILRQDPELTAVAASAGGSDGDQTSPSQTGPSAVAGQVPAQLPLDVRDFVGRDAELAALDSLLDRPGPPAISVVSGTAGVGKTSLAVHWAHRAADAFPDGQLYVNLRGFDAGGVVTDPSEALRGFLDALGVPPATIPSALAAQAALYRSLLAGKRVLILLDNAHDADQVRPLLPAAPGCLVIVTSRDPLTSLVAAEGADPLALGLLGTSRARDLLVRRLGSDRADSDPVALERITARCAGLPLALAIAAARMAVRPDFPLAVFADELAETGSLDVLHGGDAGTDLRSLFSWSCRTLSTDAARMFRLLGLHPGPDLDARAAASLAAVSVGRARRLVAELSRANLITEHVPGRYTFHDLLRAYASELADEEEAEAAKRQAVRRVLDYYLHSAHAAEAQLGPRMVVLTPEAASAGVAVNDPGSHREASSWFTAEHRVLVRAVSQAHDAGFDRHAWQLAHVCTAFLHRRNLWRDVARVHRVAQAAAERSGDVAGRAHALRGLGLADRGRGDLAGAQRSIGAALRLFERVGDPAGQALSYQSLAWIAGAAGRDREALEHSEQALRLCREAADEETGEGTGGEAVALNDLGWYHARLGEYGRALECCQLALGLLQLAEDEYGQAHTWDSLGYIHRHLGDHLNAVACYRRALRLFRQSGDYYSEATGLTYLGDAHHAVGDFAAADAAWRQALRTLDRLGHPDAANVRNRLRSGEVEAVAYSA
ncbi:MAG: tetratricopeptide repeat protein [Catenulispora sp.]|nr:tetratricopeptide repeat protein [Catenulispora sp.]